MSDEVLVGSDNASEVLDNEEALLSAGDDEITEDEGSEDKAERGTGINFSKAVVRDKHGVVDEDATFARIRDEYRAWMATNEVETPMLANAVRTVFDKLPPSQKAMIDLNGLASRAVEEMKVPYGAETRLALRVKDFVRGESLRFVGSKGAEGMYHIKRGKDGGVRLNTTAYVTEYRKLQAKKAAAKAG
jgi:hypothetical protein